MAFQVVSSVPHPSPGAKNWALGPVWRAHRKGSVDLSGGRCLPSIVTALRVLGGLRIDIANPSDDCMTCQPSVTPTLPDGANRGLDLTREAGRFLRNDDEPGLRRYLARAWSIGELAELLQGDDSVVSWLAAYCLGTIGGPVSVMPLARALHHEDAAIVAAAEDGLWRIWFDEAGVAVRRRLQRAADQVDLERFDAARAILEEIIARHPTFSEAYNQRSILRYLQDDHLGALADCKRTISLNRCHFGAHAGLGHAHAHLGNFQDAIACYKTALQIHPRMDGLRQSIRRIGSLANRANPVA